MSTVSSIGASDYFKDPSTELSKDLDFNKDGTVDIADYRYAKFVLSDDDSSNDSIVTISATQLENAFASLLRADTNNGNKANEITETNALEMSEKVVAEIKKSSNNPQNATSLNNLQEIGKTLTRKIAECTTISQVLQAMIDKDAERLEDLEEDKEQKEYEYDSVKEEINDKTKTLNENIVKVLEESQTLNAKRKEECSQIVKQSVYDYTHGKYINKPLANVIADNLAECVAGANFATSKLQNDIRTNQNLGKQINLLCSDIDTISSSIKSTITDYNNLNGYVNACKTNRSKTIKAGQTASNLYQTGYQKRLDMRDEIVDQYHVAKTEGADTCGSGNAQVQALAKFLNNRELNNMPFADAWDILQRTFDNCGLEFKESKSGGVTIAVPEGHDSTATNIYNALVNAIQSNYGDITERTEDVGYEDTTVPDDTTIVTPRTDPFSFTQNNVQYDFIQDRNGDGIFNDKSEFLGAQNGIEELKSYDINGDGQIAGDELAALKMVGINQENGQYSFTNALAAGISSIDLNSYKKVNKEQISNDLLVGTFDVNMKNGEVIEGKQTEDHGKNITNKYSNIFGSEIKDLTDEYQLNQDLDAFKDKIDTNATIYKSSSNIDSSETTVNEEENSTNRKVNATINSGIEDGNYQKKKIDKKNEEQEIEQKKSKKSAE